MFPSFLTTLFFSISVVCGHRSAKIVGGNRSQLLAAHIRHLLSFRLGLHRRARLDGRNLPAVFCSAA